jgi:hypothetical protein
VNIVNNSKWKAGYGLRSTVLRDDTYKKLVITISDFGWSGCSIIAEPVCPDGRYKPAKYSGEE